LSSPRRLGSASSNARDTTVTQCAGLGRDATAVQSGDDVHAVLVPDGLQRLANVALEGEPGEVLLERAPVDEICARARTEVTRAIAVLRLPVAR